jgi:tellurite resistance protein TerC
MYNVSPLMWALTAAWFFGLLLGDLFLSRRHQAAVGTKAAIIRSIVWISLGLGFGVVVSAILGSKAGSEYFTGFIIEKSLSVDNIFVWSALLAYLKIPRIYHYTVLFWGIVGAIFFRTIFMIGGVVILENFQFMLIILGLLLLFTASRIFVGSDETFSPENSKIIGFVKKYLPFSNKIYGKKLFVKENGRRVATFLFFSICIIELTDILFAVDSVPTVLAVVRDPYVALTSNIAAIFGLRALYFVFENLKNSFWLLNKGLAIILGAIGVSLLLEPTSIFGYDWIAFEPPIVATLLFIFTVLFASIIGSIFLKNPKSS